MTVSTASSMNPLGASLVRIVVPLWVLAGAAFKLYERNPGNLPSVILANLKDHIDAMLQLRILIGCELFAVGVMIFVPRFARAMAIFMLTCFCVILVGEMIRGATKCGCFGSLPFKPWHMLVIDGSLLLGVLIFTWPRAHPAPGLAPPAKPSYGASLVACLVLAAAGMSVALAVPTQKPVEQVALQAGSAGAGATDASNAEQAATTPATDQGAASRRDPAPEPPTQPATAPLASNINPSPKALPATWYTTDMDQWIGKPWRDIELFQLMPRWPKDLDSGKRFVIFYSRTCEHCQAMFEQDLILPHGAPVTVVEIPQSRTEMRAEGAWPMPPGLLDIEFLQLPLGVNWLIQPPLAIAVENGKVTCAKEGDHKPCMGIP